MQYDMHYAKQCQIARPRPREKAAAGVVAARADGEGRRRHRHSSKPGVAPLPWPLQTAFAERPHVARLREETPTLRGQGCRPRSREERRRQSRPTYMGQHAAWCASVGAAPALGREIEGRWTRGSLSSARGAGRPKSLLSQLVIGGYLTATLNRGLIPPQSRMPSMKAAKTITLLLALGLAGGCSVIEYKPGAAVGREDLKNGQGHVIGYKDVTRDVATGEEIAQIALFVPRSENGQLVGYEELVRGGSVLRDLNGKRIGGRFIDSRS